MLNISESSYDIVVIDEGHKAKNDEAIFAKKLKQLRVKGNRILLTGTPIQNNLNELWTVFDTVQKGLLGRKEDFEYYYSTPISKGLLSGASH
jgi:SNF2 family DNA or RNA helicase